ncbi:hypothetical protein yc1106_06922 [Curvularia clavata]|uniref:Nucleoside phosphorylase domain-containing protein n=1 Tax=Curvularia clavata TaxID=95742 RepID=A0A9Q8ZF84_CURCL|nr:hypothetical protein yc1106_06922 [Curvularia clavata]
MAPRLHRDHYMVLWVCALPIELAAARAMLDEEHDIPLPDARLSEGSNIKHIYGRVGRHNVVITRLLKEKEGAYSAADTLVKDMMRVFTSLRFGLMVGIAGGVPSKKADIRLGDVVVSSPYGLRGGVVQYTYDNSNNRIRTESSLNWPLELYDAIANLRAEHRRVRRKLYQHLSKFESLLDFTQETAGPDTLYAATYHHQGGAICLQCDKSYLVDREPRSQELGVMVHYGTIASGDRIMKSAIERDKFSAQLGDVLCFETEIAGMSNSVPSLVIRGISDYADSHKNDRWQAYAAATAAAYAKVVLSTIAKRDVAKMPMNYKVIRGPWENPVSRQEYKSIKELVNEIAADHHISFNSITWEWVLPAIPQPDMKNDVVLMCTSSRAHTAADFAHVHALTYWDYLKQSRWADFIMEILETLALVELDTAHGGFRSGKGLETSFDLMIMLAASEFCLKIKDSLVFLGYRTLLYPVKIEGNCAQFHLITTDHGQINPYTLDLKNILPVDNSSQFKTMRCFVGWCKDAHINLGTERLATQIRYTGGEDHPTSLELDGYSLLGQFGASAPLSAIVGVQQNFKYVAIASDSRLPRTTWGFSKTPHNNQ